MLKFVWLFLLLQSSLFSLELDDKIKFNELLSHSKIYKDNSRSENILTIQNKKFKVNEKKILGYGYSPNFDVWIKFKLTNTTSHNIEKIIEYNNPLTSYVAFFEEKVLRKKDGLLNLAQDRQSLNPILKITLKANETKEFYIKVSSKITTLILELNVWNTEEFYSKDTNHKIILALFFGAMGIITLYNLIIFLITWEQSYFYYVLFFVSSSFHHLMYKGIGTLYFMPEIMKTLINCSSCIVAMPTISLALFTRHILKLKQYPKLNKGLISLLILYPVFIIFIQITDLHQYRNHFFIIILLYLFIVTTYALVKKNKKAPLIFLAWILFVSAGTFMQLSSVGSYTIFEQFPYYVEFSLILVVLIFSSLLASKIKTINHEKMNVKKNKLLLKELNHRIKNSMQTIISILILQKEIIEDKKTNEILTNLENRIRATAELYSLLQIEDDITMVNMHEYFSFVTNNIEKSFKQKNIKINIHSSITMNSEYAIYCGLIVNEAVSNAFQHAFNNSDKGTIEISFYKETDIYHLIIKDDGSGMKEEPQNNSLGLTIIEILASLQLSGTLTVNKGNGVEIKIIWRDNEK